jgi:HK97 family phage portal protein
MRRVWPFKSRPQKRAGAWTLADPRMAMHFGYSLADDDLAVTERSALGLSAFWRAGSLISGTIATLPLGSFRETDGELQPVPSWLDDPGKAVDLTPFEWKEMSTWHLFLGGDCFLYLIRNGAGAVIGAQPVHASCVSVEWITEDDRKRLGLVGRKKFSIVLEDGHMLNNLDSTRVLQIMGPSLDGLRGMSVLTIGRLSLSTAIAGDVAAKRLFRDGGRISMIATPDEDFEEGDAEAVHADLVGKMRDPESGGIAVPNRRLKLQPWSMSATDAEFLAQRAFGIEEVARWTGVPPHLLMQTDKQTSWGTGVAEQNLGLRQYNLMGYTSRMESRFGLLTPKGQMSRFDYAELERPSPKDEASLWADKYQKGLCKLNEARVGIGLPKVPGGERFFGEADPTNPEVAPSV